MTCRKTKIVATLGPASASASIITRLIRAGLDVARLNFSHGDHQSHARLIKNIRIAEKKAGRPVAILADLCGPKMRTGEIQDNEMNLKKGDEVTVLKKSVTGKNGTFSTTYANFIKDIKPGHRVFLDDGNLELKTRKVFNDRVVLKIVQGGILKSHKGFNLPDTDVSTPSVTRKDISDLEFALEHGADYIALSFVRKASDVKGIKKRIKRMGKNVSVIAKVEKEEAVKDIEKVAEAADGIMVARGDLGVEMELESVAVTQKKVIEVSSLFDRPVITATQMLESMCNSPRPTRAEVTDVSNAIFDGTDALMLSGETASGDFPVLAVKTMAKIACRAEAHLRDTHAKFCPGHPSQTDKVAEAVTNGLCMIQEHLAAKAVGVFSVSGKTARYLSKNRTPGTTYGFTLSPQTGRRMALYFGINPVIIKPKNVDQDGVIDAMRQELLKRKLVKKKDVVLVSLGHPVTFEAPTNTIRIVEI